ncbi:hypothetical protein [Sessilibacter corallicola]|uniref:hypothetical protein n=1 Tax=Sessilibacter corallicola TaxID=2904075 RepID=UPI001E371369|nr:hypothetical protein [Sessilibacter corallicola]MCE2028726.1 hypothetical protein [Sessilibacter corallicola]
MRLNSCRAELEIIDSSIESKSVNDFYPVVFKKIIDDGCADSIFYFSHTDDKKFPWPTSDFESLQVDAKKVLVNYSRSFSYSEDDSFLYIKSLTNHRSLEFLLELIFCQKVSVIIASVNSFLLLADFTHQKGVNLSSISSVRALMIDGFSISDAMIKNLKSIWGLDLVCNVDLTVDTDSNLNQQSSRELNLDRCAFTNVQVEQAILQGVTHVLSYHLMVCKNNTVIIRMEIDSEKIADKKQFIKSVETNVYKELGVRATVIISGGLNQGFYQGVESTWQSARVIDARKYSL